MFIISEIIRCNIDCGYAALKQPVLWNLLGIVLLFVALFTSVGSVSSSSWGSCTIASLGTVSYGASSMGWLRTDGKQIVDSNGNTVILRGAMVFGYQIDPKLFQTWDLYTEEDYERMASWGFNIIRLPIAWHWIEPEEGVYSQEYLQIIDRAIAWANQNGIYVFLDLHQYHWSPHFSWSYTGEGMPAWLVNEYPDSHEGEKQAKLDFWLGKGPNGAEATADNPSMQDRCISVWELLASRYAGVPGVAGYDLFNEPMIDMWEIYGGDIAAIDNILKPFYEKVVDGIRSVDYKHIIWYESGGSLWDPFTQKRITIPAFVIDKPNLIVELHNYAFRRNYSGDATFLENQWNEYWWPAFRDLPFPLFIGEFGTRLEYPNPTLWLRDWLSIYEQLGLSWTYSSYGKSDSDTMFLCHADGTLREEWLQYLRRE